MFDWTIYIDNCKLHCKLTTEPLVFRSDISSDQSSDTLSPNVPNFNFSLFSFLADQFPGHLKQYYLQVENESGILAFAALQQVDFRFFDYINEKRFNKYNGFRNFIRRILYKPGRVFDGHILVLGHLLLSGVKTTWISPDFPENLKSCFWSDMLESVAENCFGGIDFFSALAVIANGPEVTKAEYLNPENWKSASIYPIMELKLRAEWEDFYDYFNSLRSRYKKKVRSVTDKSAEMEVRKLSPDDLETHQDKIMSLFKNVLDASSYTLLEPEANFFHQLIQMENLDYHISGVFFKGEMIAFFSWFKYNGVTEGHFLGYNRDYIIEYDLYKFILLRLIEIAIQGKSKSLVLGRTATIVKADLGAMAVNSIVLVRPVGFIRRMLFPLYYGLFYNRFSFRERNVFN